MKDHHSRWIHNGLTCRDVTDRASEYLASRLSILTNIRVSLHLASCGHCRTYMKQIGLVRETLARIPKQAPLSVDRLRLRHHFAASHSH